MSADDLDQKLDRLREATERISANLVELEVDPTRQLLDASALLGESAARWSAASAAVTELWRRESLLEALVQRADKVRGSRRAEQLRALLEEPSIELGSSDVPLAQRNLLGGSQIAERCSPDELLRGMSSSFDQVKNTLADIGSAWEALMPKLDSAQRLAQEAEALATDLGDSARGDLGAARASLRELSKTVTTDPLSISPSTVDRLVSQLNAVRDDLQGSAALKRDLEARLLAARELQEQLLAVVRETQAAHEELVAKISPAAAPLPPPPGRDLDAGLDGVSALAQRGSWREARRALDDWTAQTVARRDDARRALEANRAPIEERNQFRALLEAYRAKAKSLGLIEDPGLAEIFARAQDVLYTAPTDLTAAAELVRSYQRSLDRARPTPEAAL
jgi:hypothetical protein